MCLCSLSSWHGHLTAGLCGCSRILWDVPGLWPFVHDSGWCVTAAAVRVMMGWGRDHKDFVGSMWLVYLPIWIHLIFEFYLILFLPLQRSWFQCFCFWFFFGKPGASRKTNRSNWDWLVSPAAWSKHPSNIATFPATCWGLVALRVVFLCLFYT